jgi:competence protein ComEA
LATRESKPVGATTEQAEVQKLVRLQEAEQIRAQAREAARVEAWAQARAGIRGALIFTVLAALAVGIIIGAYGLRPSTDAVSQEIVPPERWNQMGDPDQMAKDGAVLSPTITPWPIRVYVSGAVAEAQVLMLPPGSLVVDALKAAGGMTENADQDALNLAAPLFDNQHLLVPTRRALSPSTESDADLANADVRANADVANADVRARININTATADELQLLPSIGVVRAHDIVTFRDAHGPFVEVEDILAVPGIGPAIFEDIAPFITVGP